MKEIIIDKQKELETIALLENGNVVEKYEKGKKQKVSEGNIYCGIVRNILPGLQSAFIDIGESKNAFIHIKDILPKASNQTGNKEEKIEKYDINKYIKSGSPILVQVKKDEENKKGARVSKHINLTGVYAVLMPDVDFVTVSQKIEDNKERERLKDIATQILSKLNSENCKYGIILRTSAAGKSKENIEKDVKNLLKLWNKILKKYNAIKENRKPEKIYESDDIIKKLIIGTTMGEQFKIYTNSKTVCSKIEKTLEDIENINGIVELRENLDNLYDYKKQIAESDERKIWLKCGGFITIDKTEALTAIDINSGKFTGHKHNSKEDTVYRVNKEATIEIARQLRLRNISGIIVIDYIDMEEEEDKNNIVNILCEELKKDRSKTQVIGFTKLDLLEMTRKKI